MQGFVSAANFLRGVFDKARFVMLIDVQQCIRTREMV